jgi:hypothetical protein
MLLIRFPMSVCKSKIPLLEITVKPSSLILIGQPSKGFQAVFSTRSIAIIFVKKESLKKLRHLSKDFCFFTFFTYYNLLLLLTVEIHII